MAFNLPLMPRLANLNAPAKIVYHATEVLEQPRFLVVNPRNERVVDSLAPASPDACRQRRKGFGLATTELAVDVCLLVGGCCTTRTA
jgi:hypothetical protein